MTKTLFIYLIMILRNFSNHSELCIADHYVISSFAIILDDYYCKFRVNLIFILIVNIISGAYYFNLANIIISAKLK